MPRLLPKKVSATKTCKTHNTRLSDSILHQIKRVVSFLMRLWNWSFRTPNGHTLENYDA